MMRILKPNPWKIGITLGLFSISSILWRAYAISRISDTFPLGFPFQFYLSWGPCQPGQNCSEANWLLLVFDAVIWYLVSAIVVDRTRKKTS